MSYAELISRLRALPPEGRVRLFDFSELFEARFGLVMDDAQWDEPNSNEIPSSHAGAGLH